MTQPVILLAVDARGVATVTLNRPEVGNAYNADMLATLIEGLRKLGDDASVRCLVVRGAGKHFQAGADIRWLGQVARYAPEENFAASMLTTRAMQLLNEFPKPTVALVHGACFGGGCGLVCCADVAFATPDAQFGITEIRIGVAPTPISTHMVNAIGLRHTRRYALTGERFDAQEAARIGLVHEVVAAEATEEKLAGVLDAIFLGGPGAIASTKRSFSAPTVCCWTSGRWRRWRTRAGCSATRRRGTKVQRRSRRSASQPGTGRPLSRASAS